MKIGIYTTAEQRTIKIAAFSTDSETENLVTF